MTEEGKGSRIDRLMDEALRELTSASPSGDLRARVASRLDDRPSLFGRFPRLLPAAAVAGVVLALAASLVLLRPSPRTATSAGRPTGPGAQAQDLRRQEPAHPATPKPEVRPAPVPPQLARRDTARPAGRPHRGAPPNVVEVPGRTARREVRPQIPVVILAGGAQPPWGVDPFATPDVPSSTPLPAPSPVVVAPLAIADVQLQQVVIEPIELAPVDQSQPPSPLPRNEAGKQ